MTAKGARLTIWVADGRQFTFWLSVAFLGGAGPNLAGMAGVWPLAASTAVAAVTGLVMWVRHHRKVGIGVYVHLPRPDDGSSVDQDALLKTIQRWMRHHHQDWFRSGPDRPSDSGEQRVSLALDSIRHRLAEIEVGSTPPVYLYAQCHHEEAFLLGKQLGRMWGASIEGVGPWSRQIVEYHVRQVSDRSKEPYRLDISAVTKPDGHDTSVIMNDRELTGSKNRLAIAVHAANPDGADTFEQTVIKAASGLDSQHYLLEPGDECDHILLVRISIDQLIRALVADKAAPILSAIHNRWQQTCKLRYGTTDVPVRLFLQGPSILVIAMATWLPESSRIVPWEPSVRPAASGQEVQAFVAILDGDDVGNGMERRLLDRDLNSAIRYSQDMDQAMRAVAEALGQIQGVTQLAAGGDSAVFLVKEDSVVAFERAVDQQRRNGAYRFSCGYGPDSREAFIALRTAKTNGKNTTVGGR